MSDDPTTIHPACLDPEALFADCELRRVRRSGPGGQHRNKVETGVVLVHRATGLTAEASERRSSAANRARALHRLRLRLAVEHRGSAREGPSDRWLRRCGPRIAVNPDHEDFPALLAEALDVIFAHEADVRAGASLLGCTPSQLVRFLKLEAAAFAAVNRWRADRELHVLK